MKKSIIILSSIFMLCFLGCGSPKEVQAQSQAQNQSIKSKVKSGVDKPQDVHVKESIAGEISTAASKVSEDMVIQLALLLDTSGSMSGLIDQAKAQLWRIVNELVKAQKEGQYARLEVALYEYGNDGLDSRSGWIRQVLPFSEDLDKISEELFAFRTNGGSEHCGQVIGEAMRELTWSDSENNLKIIYIAGNEEFTQGPVDFKQSCKQARNAHVIVNTIHCGSYDEGVRGKWQQGAKLAKGAYANIDHNRQAVNVDAPQDDELVRLNGMLNATYIAYGVEGRRKQARQTAQDANASKVSKSVMAKRTISKSSRLYKNSSWDLVDAVEQKEIDVGKVKQSQLPKELQGKSKEEIEAYIEQKKKERVEIKQKIVVLQKERAVYVQKRLQELQAKGEATLDQVIINTLRKQAESKGFVFKEM